MAEQPRTMRYISLFSGIEAASLAWEDLGLEPVAFSEIEPFPCAVLAHRFPEVPNLGDITKIDWSDYADKGIDIIVGGSPCQSFSVAGKREGLAGASGLMFEYIRAVQEVMPRWIVWENVPGALSSENGAAFGQLLRELDALGYGLAWRVLDAQFFGVAQRRQRLFLVGSLGEAGARRACEVLFEPDCLQGDLTSSREKRKELAARAARGAGAPGGGGRLTIHQNQAGDVHVTHDLTGTLTAGSSVSRQQLVFGEEPAEEGGCLTPWGNQSKRIFSPEGCGPTLNSGAGRGSMSIQPSVLEAIPINTMIATRGGKLGRGTGFGVAEDGDPAYTITATHPHAVCAGFGYKVSPGAGSIGYREEQVPTLLAGRCDASVLIKADPEPTYCIQGSMIGRTDENGPQGSGINEDISFTLNTVDRHAVTAFAVDRATTPKFSEELCHTLRRGGAGGCNDAAAVISQYGDIAGTLTARYDSSPCPARDQNIVGNRSVVRRLTPRECERLQGMPSVVHLEVDSMTPDEIAACALANGDIFCDFETGTVYGTRGPGGKKLDKPIALGTKHPSGYIHVHLSANGEKRQVRAHRIIYMAAYGPIPDGMVIDHINNNKSDNRLCNLQLMTPEENSGKAKKDGRYKTGEENGRCVITAVMRSEIKHDYSEHGMTYRQLAEKYGVSKSRIGQIAKEDDWTRVPYRGKTADQCPDGPRYKAIGNSMAVPVMRWIGEGIVMVEAAGDGQ